MSQTTTDLHDAYRNAFLALESLLDHLHPQQREGEGAWFARAMSAADGMIGLAAQLFPNNPDPVKATVDEFYRQWRTAVAHSKASRTFVLPHDAQDRLDLINSLGRLTRYYIGLAEHVFHTHRATTHFTKYVFERMAKSFADYEVYASDDASPFDTSDSQPAPSGGALVAMTPAGDIELPEPFLARRVWANPAVNLGALTAVRRIVGTKDGKAGFVLVLEADLVLDNDDQLEARFAWSTIGRTDLRSRYAT